MIVKQIPNGQTINNLWVFFNHVIYIVFIRFSVAGLRSFHECNEKCKFIAINSDVKQLAVKNNVSHEPTT